MLWELQQMTEWAVALGTKGGGVVLWELQPMAKWPVALVAFKIQLLAES